MKTILSLDVETKEAAKAFSALSEEMGLSHVKVGHVLLSRLGIDQLREVIGTMPLFLDLKFFDIPNTVAEAIKGYKSFLPTLDFFTIWGLASETTIRAARESTDARMLAVIQLTSESFDEHFFLTKSEKAIEAGADGLICPASLAPLLRKTFGKEILLVSPGIRRIKGGDDQVSVSSPEEAKTFGVDYIVVGRPIIKANNPQQAMKEYIL